MSLSIYYTIFSFLTILIGSNLTFGVDHHPEHKDLPSVHGMFVFGKDKVYLSHLPMFHSPHDYQVLIEVELPEEVKAVYLEEKLQDKFQSVYTIVPESFILPEVMTDGHSFKAVLYKGHFERGGSPITKEINITIKKVLYFKQFDKSAVKTPTATATAKYIIIGNKTEQFIIHKVIAKPDFDQVIKLNGSNKALIAILLKTTHLNVTIPSSLNTVPLKEGENLIAKLSDNQNSSVSINIKKSLYLEYGDLSF
ncbi:MAG: hypothetical protein ACJAS4_002752 [Bacteriovoracaceae bacterium]|jgi:hypothetical protein